jgi:ATP-binding cassette, subfamily B, bacterial
LAFAAVATGGLADVLDPWPLKVAFDSVLGAAPPPEWFAAVAALFGSGPSALTAATAVFVLAVAFLGAASSFAQKYLSTSVAEAITRDLRHLLYHHLERLALSYYDRQRLGELLVFLAYLGKVYKPMRELAKMTDTL